MSETGPRALPVSVRWEVPPASGQRSGEGEFVLPVGTVTLLLADVEGSTRLWEGDADAMTAAVAHLDRVVDEAIGCHGGVRPVEQGEGDSFVAAFARASDAVAAALTLQRSDLAPIALRVGLHTGEVQLRDEANYIGSAVNRCARVRDLAHGGQTLLSQPVHDLVADHLPAGAWLIDLGTHRLRDLARGEHVYQVAHADLRVEFPALRSLEAYPNNLPVQMSSFVGRAAEVAQVVKLLADARLVTLTGSGGCGKTRLALHTAAEVLADHGDGVWHVDLASVVDPELVASAVAKTLRLDDVPSRSTIETIVAYLRDRRVLLVIDNCEHLINASAKTIDALLQSCPSLTVLATSREPLSINGETAWRVPSLALPDDTGPAPVANVSTCEAVELFVERATRARPDFELTANNSDAVVDICRRLDGIPLAIELAAARVRAFTPEQISVRLHDRFRLLTGGARTAVPRQHTLRASVDWSHQLLTEPERVLFRRLAVFAGSFDLAAAEAVGAGDPLEGHQVLDQLSLLVDKSLVVAVEATGEFRYRFLETVRHYAQERLTESDEADMVRERHRDWFLDLAEHTSLNSFSTAVRPSADRQVTELDNLRAAFSWSRDSGDHVAALRLAAALQTIWLKRGYETEGRQWLEISLANQAGADARTRVRALGASALLETVALTRMGQERGDQAVAVARDDGNLELLAWALTMAAWSCSYVDPPRSVALAEEAVEVARRSPQPRGVAPALCALGAALLMHGDLVGARQALEEERVLRASEDDPGYLGGTFLSSTLMYLGELRAAREMARAVVLHASRFGDRRAAAVGLFHESLAAARMGDPVDAHALAERSLAMVRDLGSPGAEVQPYVALGAAAMAQGDPRAAQRAFKRACDLVGPAGRVNPKMVAELAEAEVAAGDHESAARHVLEARNGSAGRWRGGWSPALLVEARLAMGHGDSEAAEDLGHQALGFERNSPSTMEMADTLEWLASLAVHHESYVEGARIFGVADTLREATGAVRYRVYDEWYASSVAALRDAMGADELEKAWAEGAALSLDEALAYVGRGRGERKRPSTGWASLTPAERDVARLVGDGLDNKEIAERLFISPRTVQAHLTHIYGKLAVSSRVRLAQEASQHV